MKTRFSGLVACAVLLAACGGGGGGGDQPPPAPNQPPTANAGADQTVVENTVVTLDGSGSSDPNGQSDIVSYQWAYVSGGTGNPGLSNANTVQASFTAQETPSGSPYVFELTVTDGDGEQSTDQVQVTAVDAASSVVLSGTVTYDGVPHNTSTNGLNYNAITEQAVRGATVQLLNASSTVVDTTTTDDNGDYQFVVSPGATVRVRVRAELLATGAGSAQWNTRVVDNTSGGAIYTLDGNIASVGAGPTQTRDLRALSGWTGSAYTQPRAAAPFSMLDDIYGALIDVAAVDSDVIFPELVVNWSVNNSTASGNLAAGAIGTSFYQRIGGNSNIYVLGAANSDTDEYDGHIIVHEWGHYFEDRLSRSDSIGGPHGQGDRLDMRVAFGEGFGNALSGIITDDPFYRDSFGNNQAQGFSIDVESGFDPSVGWYSEGSVQQILYDLYDATNDGADQDSIALGFGPLYEVLTSGDYRTNDAWTSIFSFATALRSAQPTQASGIDATLNNQNIVSGLQLDAYGSNETNNAGNANDVLPVYTVVNVGTTSGQICSIGTAPFGDQNKLSNWRFVRVTIPAPGDYTITVNGGTDPDYVVLQGGVQVRSFGQNGAAIGVETDTVTLQAGDASLAIAEFNNIDNDSTNNGRSCLTVSITAG